MHFTATNTSNPVAKYLELVGFRINERKPGQLQIQFGVANHSEADIGDVKMTVNLGTTAAKPGEPPIITFPASVSKLGPSELKDVNRSSVVRNASAVVAKQISCAPAPHVEFETYEWHKTCRLIRRHPTSDSPAAFQLTDFKFSSN